MIAIDSAHELLRAGRPADALAELVTAANAGDAPSALELGVWFLEGKFVQRDLHRSRAAFGRAAELGEMAAERVFTSFLAIGVGAAPDWEGALQRLRQFAARDALAAEQLELLERMDLTQSGDPLESAFGQQLSVEPEIYCFERLFSSDECAFLISAAQPLLQPSVVVEPSTGELRPHPIRTSEGAMFPWASEDLVVHALNRRLAAASATPVACGEPLQVLRYGPGQEYRPHIDALPQGENQRIFTMLVYLNHDYQGGETLFNRTGLAFRGDIGTALLFRNSLPDGSPDRKAQHAGLPVVCGEKFIASRWIREQPLMAR